jgi:hypothetical protein
MLKCPLPEPIGACASLSPCCSPNNGLTALSYSLNTQLLHPSKGKSMKPIPLTNKEQAQLMKTKNNKPIF